MIQDQNTDLTTGVRAEVQGIKDGLRRYLEPVLQRQLEHPVWPKVEVLWSEPYNLGGIWTRTGELMEYLNPDEIVGRIRARNTQIEGEDTNPLRYSCEPEIWRLIDIEMCKKRLAHPGMVLELLVTGGIRPGKTEGATRRGVAHHFYTEKAWSWFLHQTEVTSRGIQQKRVFRFLPPELQPESGKMKKDRRTKFAYNEGTGFTGSMFNIYWEAHDENGEKKEYGGEVDFRFYKQDEATLQGSEITFATSDELVPLPVVNTVKERLSTRAADTAKPEFLARIRQALQLLEARRPLPLALLGLIYHSVHIITFTPKEGWNPTINTFLQGAKKYGWVTGAALVGKAGVKDARVPRFAQPTDPLKLVAYLHTIDNVIKPAYPAVLKAVENKPEAEIRITLYGDVDKDWQVQFPGYKPERHVRTWADVPRDGTIYEICDPAGRRPWVVMWILCDVAGRHWIIQEWPCEHIDIDGGPPGPWAIPSENENLNGDEGPAYKMKLQWNRKRYTRMIWQGRQRILQKMRETGKPFEGDFTSEKLVWPEQPDWTLEGEFVRPATSIMDSRYAGAQTETATRPNETVTVLEAMALEENPIDFIPASGDSLNEGDILINGALDDDVLGMPGLIVLDECTNTQFTLSTYTLPPHRDNPKQSDEVCKDFRDPIAYYLKSGPCYIPKQEQEDDDEGGCGY